MNIINEILEKLMTAAKPVAKQYYKNDNTTVLFIGFNEGMVLEKHKTNIPARLMVMKGKVIYKQRDAETTLYQYDTKEIPVNIIHEVYAVEDSICLLIKG